MAAAGPLGNLIIALLAFGVMRAGLAMEWFVAPDHVSIDSIVELAGAPVRRSSRRCSRSCSR